MTMQGTATDAAIAANVELVHKADAAVNARDVDAFLALMTDDVIWESTAPPDGERHAGKAAVRAGGEGFFSGSPNARFENEEVVATVDRAFARWTYHWVDEGGQAGHVRGVDIYRFRDGKIAEILSYVKG
jgi:ketosteroid isomerase-like protein